MIKRIFSILMLLVALIAQGNIYGVQNLPNVQAQDHTKHLVNPDGIISLPVQAQIDSLLIDARRASSAEIVAVIVDEIDSDDIDTFATSLFNAWNIGKKDKNNGILLIVAKDQHIATIRTGYGAEGVLPDILAGRIIYDVMIPRFREGDYEGGMLAGVQELHKIATDPKAAAELQSAMKDKRSNASDVDAFAVYLGIGGFVTLIMAILLIVTLWRNKDTSDYDKYIATNKYGTLYWVLALLFMGIPVLVALPLYLLRHYWRNHQHKCMRCGARMDKLDEEIDNSYLTPSQDLEEKLNSVDYDVWRCPECGETDIYPFVNQSSTYKECGNCHARALKLYGNYIYQQPTYTQEGIGMREYHCLNCKQRIKEPYKIPKKEKPVVVVAPGIGSGIGGSRGSGGSFGGGFGGGFTGGGGATGRW